jgi:hypothetical protein
MSGSDRDVEIHDTYFRKFVVPLVITLLALFGIFIIIQSVPGASGPGIQLGKLLYGGAKNRGPV